MKACEGWSWIFVCFVVKYLIVVVVVVYYRWIVYEAELLFCSELFDFCCRSCVVQLKIIWRQAKDEAELLFVLWWKYLMFVVVVVYYRWIVYEAELLFCGEVFDFCCCSCVVENYMKVGEGWSWIIVGFVVKIFDVCCHSCVV